MNSDWQTRTELLLGSKALERIEHAHVLCAGLGGVGGIAVEMLVRTGLGELTIVDGDVVEESNRNRQIFATTETAGMLKTDAAAKRLMTLNPDLKLHCHSVFLRDETLDSILDAAHYDCVLDAIDTLSPKIHLIAGALRRGLKIVSSMGSGARLDPERIRCVDLEKTCNCTLARAVRHGLHKLGLRGGCRAVFSDELPRPNAVFDPGEMEHNKRSVLGTISYMPNLFGCHCAAEILKILAAS